MKTTSANYLMHWLGVIITVAAFTAFADVKLPALISDHMVLQAGEPVPVWGWAAPEEKISVDIGEQQITTQADAHGEWRVELKPLKTGAHLTLMVQGLNTIVVKDVLAGEVWLGSGQSNMGLQVKNANDYAAEMVAADLPEMRIFTMASIASTNALDDCQGSWRICNSNNVGNFSAALYFFGREIYRQLNVPVGLIHSSWGGTPIQPWMPLEVLTNFSGYAALLERKKMKLPLGRCENNKSKRISRRGKSPMPPPTPRTSRSRSNRGCRARRTPANICPASFTTR